MQEGDKGRSWGAVFPVSLPPLPPPLSSSVYLFFLPFLLHPLSPPTKPISSCSLFLPHIYFSFTCSPHSHLLSLPLLRLPANKRTRTCIQSYRECGLLLLPLFILLVNLLTTALFTSLSLWFLSIVHAIFDHRTDVVFSYARDSFVRQPLWHSLFCQILLISSNENDLQRFTVGWEKLQYLPFDVLFHSLPDQLHNLCYVRSGTSLTG